MDHSGSKGSVSGPGEAAFTGNNKSFVKHLYAMAY